MIMCRTMQKRRVQVNGLREIQPLGAAISRSGRRELMLTFEHTSGVAGLEGRETVVRVDGQDLARMLGAIRANDLTAEVMGPYKRVLDFLRNWR